MAEQNQAFNMAAVASSLPQGTSVLVRQLNHDVALSDQHLCMSGAMRSDGLVLMCAFLAAVEIL